jgi:hypothetical protein
MSGAQKLHPQSEHDPWWILAKVAIAWVGTTLGTVTLNDLVLFATLAYTTINTYLLIRDRLLKRDKQ